MTIRLYDLTAQYAALLDAAQDEPEDFEQALQQLTGELSDKAEAVAKVIATLNGEAATFKAEADRLQAHATARANRADRLKRYLKDCLEMAGTRQLKGPLFDIRIQDNPASVEVVNEAEVDASFKRARLTLPLSEVPESLIGLATVEVDKAAIKDYAKRTGETPAGAALVRGTHLRIR